MTVATAAKKRSNNMNTIWLKIAAAVVAAFIVIVVVGKFKSGEPAPSPRSSVDERTKTFYDQVEEDKARFQTSPEPAEVSTPNETSVPSEEPAPTEETTTPQRTQTQPATTQSPTSNRADTIYVKRLSEIDRIEAERLLNVAVPGRSIGRLPMTGYKLMVDNCRRIIEKWPDSFYAFQSKRLLADLPERYQMRYKVTKAETDISSFFKSRPGTEPVKVTEER
jgi:hypothetical protein